MASEPRVTYVGQGKTRGGRFILKCLTCPDKPLTTNTELHEREYHPREDYHPRKG